MQIRVVLFFSIAVLPCISTIASAGLITFTFEAVNTVEPYWAFPVPLGQRLTGTYTFDTCANPTATAIQSNAWQYDGAVTSISMTLEEFGSGHGDNGSITVGAPGLVSIIGGSIVRPKQTFLMDYYFVSATVGGLSIPTTRGEDLQLQDFDLFLMDADQTALDSVQLSEVPPDLTPFLDNPDRTPIADSAQIRLSFLSPSVSRAFNFQLTSLTVIPEPTTATLVPIGIVPAVVRRSR